MSDHIEPSTHIDVRVIRNLLESRINEGKEMMKLSTVSVDWKKKERIFLEKCRQAVKIIDEAINIKEDKINAIPNQQNQNSEKANSTGRQAILPGQKDQA